MTTKAAKQGNKEFKIVPEGTHVARCYQFLHYGHIPNTSPQAKSPVVDKIRLTFEFPEELAVFQEGKEPQPFSLSADYTLSMFKLATLRKVVSGMLGKTLTDEEADEFDVESLVGLPCLITVVHTVGKNGVTYANIQNVTSLPGKMKCPDPMNVPKIVNWTTMNPETLASFPEFIQNKLKSSTEYQEWAGNNGIETIAF